MRIQAFLVCTLVWLGGHSVLGCGLGFEPGPPTIIHPAEGWDVTEEVVSHDGGGDG